MSRINNLVTRSLFFKCFAERERKDFFVKTKIVSEFITQEHRKKFQYYIHIWKPIPSFLPILASAIFQFSNIVRQFTIYHVDLFQTRQVVFILLSGMVTMTTPKSLPYITMYSNVMHASSHKGHQYHPLKTTTLSHMVTTNVCKLYSAYRYRNAIDLQFHNTYFNSMHIFLQWQSMACQIGCHYGLPLRLAIAFPRACPT